MHKTIKKRISQIRKNTESRNLIANFGYLTVLQFAGYLFPLITLPYLAKTIGPVGFGRIAFASAVITWCISVVTWGYNYTATRDVARIRENAEKVSEIFSKIFWTRCFLMLCCFAVLLILIVLLPDFKEQASVLLVTFLMVPGHVMFPEWMFQALERMKYITILSLMSKALFTAAVFLFIHKPEDYILQPLFISLGFFLSGIISMYFIIVKWGYHLKRVSFRVVFKTIKDGTDVFINNCSPNLYNSLSTVLLGMFSGIAATGILFAGNQFVLVSQQFLNVLSRAFFPFLSRRMDKHSAYTKISLIFSGGVSLSLFLFAPVLIKLFYTDDFSDAIVLARILAFSIFFISITDVFGTNYLILKGYEKQLRNITLSYSLFGLISAIPLIYFWGFYGAAIIVSFTRALIAITVMYKARQLSKNESKIV